MTAATRSEGCKTPDNGRTVPTQGVPRASASRTDMQAVARVAAAGKRK